MKRCPACQSTYTDDTLQFCLQDGIPLENVEVETDEPETVLRTEVPEAMTVAIEQEPVTEPVTRNETRESSAEPAGNSKTLLAIILTALIMLLLFGVIGLSAYLFVNRGQVTSSATNDNSNEGGFEPGLSNNNVETTRTPGPTPDASPKPTVETTPELPEATASPTPDQTGIKKEVSELVYRWISMAEARNLGAYMDFYADRIDYYRKSRASKAFVRNDKRNAFEKYSTIRIRTSALSISPASDGKTATAVFDKEWLFANSDTRQTGKVRSQIVFRNTGGGWKIVSERDIKVYFVNK